MEVHAGQFEMLDTYSEVVSLLLRTYTTDRVLAETYTDVVTLQQNSSGIGESYSHHLWNRTLQCGSVFSDRPLKSLFVESLLPAACPQVRSHLATHRSADYQSVESTPRHLRKQAARPADKSPPCRFATA